MMLPKSIAHWQGLKAKKLGGRTVPEDVEYKKLQMKHNADVLASNRLKWKTELTEIILTLAGDNDDLMQRLNNIISPQVDDDQEPFVKKDLHGSVTALVAKIKQEQQERGHARPLGKSPLHDNEFPNEGSPDQLDVKAGL